MKELSHQSLLLKQEGDHEDICPIFRATSIHDRDQGCTRNEFPCTKEVLQSPQPLKQLLDLQHL